MATFLIIDDSPVARTFLRRALEQVGHVIVAEGENGLEGCDLYREHMPDFVTIDMTMPVMGGLECLKRIKADFPDAKAIIVSSVGKKRLQQEALELGAIRYITKPFDDEEVIKIFKSL